MPDSELIVPVPAAERQAIEAFLAEHATAAAHEPGSPRGLQGALRIRPFHEEPGSMKRGRRAAIMACCGAMLMAAGCSRPPLTNEQSRVLAAAEARWKTSAARDY